jgi:hypothetical protein
MPEISSLGKSLLVLGLGLSLIGAAFLFSEKIQWLGRLPGDVRIEKGNFSFYFPLASCVLISALLSFFAWVFSKIK